MTELLIAMNFIWGWIAHIGWPWLVGAAGATLAWVLKPGRLQAALIAAILAAAVTGIVVHRNDQKAYIALQDRHKAQETTRLLAVSQAAGQARATQATISQASGARFERTRTQIVTQTETIIKEVPTYVTVQSDAVPCNSVGLIRVLNAAAEGRSPADYRLPPGVTDDACTSLTNAAVAASVAVNYGIGRLNAGQLDDLIADVKTRIDAANASASLEVGVDERSSGSGRP